MISSDVCFLQTLTPRGILGTRDGKPSVIKKYDRTTVLTQKPVNKPQWVGCRARFSHVLYHLFFFLFKGNGATVKEIWTKTRKITATKRTKTSEWNPTWQALLLVTATKLLVGDCVFFKYCTLFRIAPRIWKQRLSSNGKGSNKLVEASRTAKVSATTVMWAHSPAKPVHVLLFLDNAFHLVLRLLFTNRSQCFMNIIIFSYPSWVLERSLSPVYPGSLYKIQATRFIVGNNKRTRSGAYE